jgi:hypothetical protein
LGLCCCAPIPIFDMLVSPEPELIVVETPPDSPVGEEPSSRVPYSRPDTVDPSPQKRVRKPSTRQRKKQKVDNLLDFNRDSPAQTIDTPSALEAPHNSVFPEGSGSEANDVPRAIENVEPLVTSNQDVVYSAAVMEERAGFYPVTRTLFVVQGWDGKRSSVTVSPSLVLGGVD